MNIYYRYFGDSSKSIDYAISLLSSKLKKIGMNLKQYMKEGDKPVFNIYCEDIKSKEQSFELIWNPEVDFDMTYSSYFTYSDEVKARKLELFDTDIAEINTGSMIAKGPAGVLYAVLELLERIQIRKKLPYRPVQISREPKMQWRSACLLMMKAGRYDIDIVESEFPWFYNKDWWVEYLDFLAENRYNALTLWNFHPFPYFVEHPEYESLSAITKEEREKNYWLLKWICEESEKRSIYLAFHFYNIYVGHKYAKSIGMNGIHTFNEAQRPLVYKYTKEYVRLFADEFPDIWLMGCLGEGVPGGEAEKFTQEVIIAALNESRNSPPLIVRQWSSLTTNNVRKYIQGKYDNLFVMMKHNAEHIASEVPDVRIRAWLLLGVDCFVNMHMISEVGPFRWSPYRFIKQTCLIYHTMGLKGIHVYPHWPWRNPGVGDIGYEGSELQRDHLYLAAWGRYCFDPVKDDDEEKRFWIRTLRGYFKNDAQTGAVIESQEAIGRALVRIQQHLWIHYDNHSIISAGFLLKEYFNAKSVHGRFIIKTDIQEDILPLRTEVGSDFKKTKDDYSIDECLKVSLDETKRAIQILREAGIRADKSEAGRYLKDAQATLLVIRHHKYKIRALKQFVLYLRSDTIDDFKKATKLLYSSLEYYRKLTEFTKDLYAGISDVNPVYPIRIGHDKMPYHWTDLLPVFEKEYDDIRKLGDDITGGDAKKAARTLKEYIGYGG